MIGEFEVKRNSYAIGMSSSASGATVGFGCGKGRILANAFHATGELPHRHVGSDRIANTTQANSETRDGEFNAGLTDIGADVSCTMGASVPTLVHAKGKLDDIEPVWVGPDGNTGGVPNATVRFNNISYKGIGVGFSHDLGGGAKLVAGFGEVPTADFTDDVVNMAGMVRSFPAKTSPMDQFPTGTSPAWVCPSRSEPNDQGNPGMGGLGHSFRVRSSAFQMGRLAERRPGPATTG